MTEWLVKPEIFTVWLLTEKSPLTPGLDEDKGESRP